MRARPLRSALAQMLRRCQARTELAAGAHIAEASGQHARTICTSCILSKIAPPAIQALCTNRNKAVSAFDACQCPCLLLRRSVTSRTRLRLSMPLLVSYLAQFRT